ncbi:MAG: hypothetical protein EU544_05595 [Promethearchaeota archaeon]|nr:MAG: hypothetical protein EU544_05595 [Candidatus Lokiarchaeota archaeon]
MFNKATSNSKDINHPSFHQVLEIAEELVDNNQVIQIDLLYKLAKRRLKIESKGLYSIINKLIQRKIIVEGTKLLRHEVLNNSYREEIFQYVKNYPGVHFSIIKEKVMADGSTGQFVWHIEVLLKFEFIKKLEIKNYSLFLPYEMDEELGTYYFLLRDRLNRRIVKHIKNGEAYKQSDIYNSLDDSKGTVIYHIQTLEEYGIVDVFDPEETRGKEVIVNSEKRELLLKIISNIEAQ